MDRRKFITNTSTLTVAAANGVAFAQSGKKRTVGIIGHTGRGNYGHGLDTVWLKIPDAEIVGVADPDEVGRKKELNKLKIADEFGFSDYRKMLEETSPEFASICPRHADQHRDMCLAAIKAGVSGVYVEKPFLRSPRECDEVLAAAAEKGTRIAVAHRNRYHPVLQVIDEAISDERLGKILEIRARGKGDRRGGAEDLWVLGTHVLNLVEYFGGAPKTCSALMLKDGKQVIASDVEKTSAEGLGPLAGNELHARFELERGIIANFSSIANDDTKNHGFGLLIVGSKGQINIQCDKNPVAHFLEGNPLEPLTKPNAWVPITSGGIGEKEPNPDLVTEVQNHVAAIRDLIASVDEQGRQPRCDARAGASTVEMVCAVFESHRQKGKAVSFPLQQRENALTIL